MLSSAFPLFPALCLCFCCTQKPAQKEEPVTAAPAVASAPAASDALPYDLANPSLTIKLANEDLREISGICPTPVEGEYAAIADERGEIFFIDGKSNGAVSRRVLFRDKGDFEDIAMVGENIWVVKSDGKLFEVSNWKSSPPKVEEFNTPLKKKDDVEGLFYDADRNALLLAPKGDPDSGYLRNIYAFDLKTKKMDPKPVYSIDPADVNKLVPYGDSEKHDFFSPSAIAIHPETGELYVISAALKRLVVLDKSGKVVLASRLDKKMLPQPEGIAFDRQHNLYISSEGKKDDGILIRFDHKKK